MNQSKWNISRGYSSREYSSIINAFQKNSKIVKNNSTAFHYTSFENCIKMLKPPSASEYYLELFASHFNYMNDTKEFFAGLEIIKEVLDKCAFADDDIMKTVGEFKTIFTSGSDLPYYAVPPHYIVSFNKKCNNLAQWKYYGKNCGIAIEYDINNCEFSNFRTDSQYNGHFSYNVNYDKAQQMSEINKIIDELSRLHNEPNKEIHCKDVLLKACAAASFMKNPHYADEEEIRLMFAPYYFDESSDVAAVNLEKLMKKVEYRPRGNEFIIPYLKIRLRSKSKGEYPIKSLTVGPGQSQKTIFHSLVMFVQSNFQNTLPSLEELPDEDDCVCIRVNDIIVRRSLIPFRG